MASNITDHVANSFFNPSVQLRISATRGGAKFRVIIFKGYNFYQSLDFLFCLLNILLVCLEELNVDKHSNAIH